MSELSKIAKKGQEFALPIIEKYYNPGSDLYKILVSHSIDVANLAVNFASKRPDLNIDTKFVYEAAMLHDIGVFRTFAPDIHCEGDHAYICHGYLGRELLDSEGLPMHALVAERHTGTGLSVNYIVDNDLPVPHRDMLPTSIEEQVICFADKFYSKTHLGEMRSWKKARVKLEKYGYEVVKKFDLWCDMFNVE